MREALKARLKSVGSSVRDFGERAAPVLRKGLKYGAIAASAVATAAKVAHDVHQTYQRSLRQYQVGSTTTRRPGSATIDHITSGIERYNNEREGPPVVRGVGPLDVPAHGRGWEMGGDGRWRRSAAVGGR